VIIILISQTGDRYDMIKQASCCGQNPVLTQCVLEKTLRKKKMAICNNLLRQVVAKLGGELWRIKIPLPRAMIVGMDVYHDTLTKGQSVVGFLASTNSAYTSYWHRVCFQKTGHELVDQLKICMKLALQNFFKINNFLPETIIVYRDGVGDGQLQAVVDGEVPQMVSSFGEKYRPKLSVIVVTKRIHTRLFAPKSDKTYDNPIPGTIVDSHIIRKEYYDFFLVSQSVKQGTATPTHYLVVFDTSGYSPDILHQLTYKLCHLYYNWSGTVRVPAPCQYAHKLAFLVGKSLHEQPAEQLSNKFFFL